MFVLCPEYSSCKHVSCKHKRVHKQLVSCCIPCEVSGKCCCTTTLQTEEEIALYILQHPELL